MSDERGERLPPSGWALTSRQSPGEAGGFPQDTDPHTQALAREILLAQAQEALASKVGRNDPCPCGSGKKYKRCCLSNHERILSGQIPRQRADLARLEAERSRCEQVVREGYELLTKRDFPRARALAQRWSKTFQRDDRFQDIMVTAWIQAGEPEPALEMARESYRRALEEKEYFLRHGIHSWEEGEPSHGHVYAPEAWLERIWVAHRAVAYKEAYPEAPEPHLVALVKELRRADEAGRFPQDKHEGLKARRQALAGVLEAIKARGSRALPYLLPICPRYSWSSLLVPELLVHWGDDPSIGALVEVAMFRYPYLSESCLQGLEELGPKVLPHLKRAFESDQEFDPLKIGLLSVAGEIGTQEALGWLTQMLAHPLPGIVNWTAGILGKKRYAAALPMLREASRRVGKQPYILWALEEMEHLEGEAPF